MVKGVETHGVADVLAQALPEWMARLVADLGLYFVLVGLGYLVIKHYQKNPPRQGDQALYARAVRFMVFGFPDEEYQPIEQDEEKAVSEGSDLAQAKIKVAEKASASDGEDKELWTPLYKFLNLSFCTAGLLGSYLVWGILQEKIVTTEYENGRFQSTVFLVVCNRGLALLVAIVVVNVTKQPVMRAPFYQYAFTSLSNVLSSWCQLEALKYISFPTQVLAKSSKMVPVMLMGFFIRGKRYEPYEYLVALLIGLGVSTFTLNSDEGSSEDSVTTLSGVFLIVGYLVFDSFTSQWQGHLFKTYKMTPYQMMIGVNIWSLLFSMSSTVSNGELWSSISFLLSDSIALRDNFIFSVAGAVGQMFIFYTIKTWGPLIFTIIMTTRQLIAIVFSTLLFGHVMNSAAASGGLICFAAIAYKIYKDSTESSAKKARSNSKKAVEMSGQGGRN